MEFSCLETTIEETDEILAQRVMAQDMSAFTTLVQRHSRRFYLCAYRVLLNQQDAEDAVQDAFCKLWSGKAGWQDGKGAKFTTWFYRIVVNQALDARSRKRGSSMTVLEETLADESDSQETELLVKREQQEIVSALETLPERQRAALHLFYTEELSQKEAAEAMGITPKALESLVGRAKTALREYMEKRGRRG